MSDKIEYIATKNRIEEFSLIVKNLQELKKMNYTLITYDNLNDVNKYMSRDNVMVPLLENGSQHINELINFFSNRITNLNIILEELKKIVPEKYHNCNYFVEVLFS